MREKERARERERHEAHERDREREKEQGLLPTCTIPGPQHVSDPLYFFFFSCSILHIISNSCLTRFSLLRNNFPHLTPSLVLFQYTSKYQRSQYPPSQRNAPTKARASTCQAVRFTRSAESKLQRVTCRRAMARTIGDFFTHWSRSRACIADPHGSIVGHVEECTLPCLGLLLARKGCSSTCIMVNAWHGVAAHTSILSCAFSTRDPLSVEMVSAGRYGHYRHPRNLWP